MFSIGPSILDPRRAVGDEDDGVDGPRRHQCARMRLFSISFKGAAQ